MKYAIAGLMCLMSLSACSSAGSEKLTAPDVVQYSAAKQDAAAKEILGGACPVLNEFAQDYCVMRDQSRILKGEKPTCTKKP